MPTRLAEIVDFLSRSAEPRRSELASFLLDADGKFRDEFAATVGQALRENDELRRATPISFYGEMAMTLYVWSPSAPRLRHPSEEHTRTVMSINNEVSRRLVELEYNSHGVLVGAHLKHVTLVGLAQGELERLRVASGSLAQLRIDRRRAAGAIGRNEQCPCGSGKKYKRCHGPSK